ncbi:MAG: hypothetical protein K2W96_01620, partial [Gemmataceae bacterium]|nr:hypothetical protein [Gemmataceae bacterium]
ANSNLYHELARRAIPSTRVTMKYPGYRRIEVWDGENFHTTHPPPPNPFGKHLAKHKYAEQRAANLLPLLDPANGYVLSIEQQEKSGKQKVVTLKVTHKDLPDVRLLFDCRTWLLAKSEIDLPLLFSTFHFQFTFSEYKDFEGCKLPMRLVTVEDWLKIRFDAHILEYRRLEKMDDALFRWPGKAR